MKRDRAEISTADVARATDDARGRGDEQMTNRSKAEAPIGAGVVPDDVETFIPRPGGPTSSRESNTAARVDVPSSHASTAPGATQMLFPGNEANGLRNRWNEVQATFVDEPRKAVERADSLVAEVMKRMAEVFAAERASLEKQWDRGDTVTTEDLRVALQRYRAFFDRLLSV